MAAISALNRADILGMITDFMDNPTGKVKYDLEKYARKQVGDSGKNPYLFLFEQLGGNVGMMQKLRDAFISAPVYIPGPADEEEEEIVDAPDVDEQLADLNIPKAPEPGDSSSILDLGEASIRDPLTGLGEIPEVPSVDSILGQLSSSTSAYPGAPKIKEFKSRLPRDAQTSQAIMARKNRTTGRKSNILTMGRNTRVGSSILSPPLGRPNRLV